MDLLESQDFILSEPSWRFGHAELATQIAAVGDGHSEFAWDSPEGVFQLNHERPSFFCECGFELFPLFYVTYLLYGRELTVR